MSKKPKRPDNAENRFCRIWPWVLAMGWVMLVPANGYATQEHGGLEGIYVHQIAHICFAVSMAFLIYWLRRKHLTQTCGWRYIQYAAMGFILWNLDAFIVHLISEQWLMIIVERTGPFTISISPPNGWEWLAMVYYIAKMDHLFCVTAVFFLYKGLKCLYEEPSEMPANGEPR